LRDALEALAGLVEAAPFPMWHRTPDLRLSLVNSAYVRAVDGADAREVIGSGVELVPEYEQGTGGNIVGECASAMVRIDVHNPNGGNPQHWHNVA